LYFHEAGKPVAVDDVVAGTEAVDIVADADIVDVAEHCL
jgi:hypothetical protein